MLNVKHVFLPFFVLALALSSYAQETKLVDAAKKEGGKVVIYGSFEPDTLNTITPPFSVRPAYKSSTGGLRIRR